MAKIKIKIGLVVGRFQPLHPGHLMLIQTALAENDRIKIAIGSAQYADPLPASERRLRLHRALDELQVAPERYEIYDLPDIHNLSRWPEYVKQVCKLGVDDEIHYYTSDVPSDEFKRFLDQAGFIFYLHPRPSFNYLGPDGQQYQFSSATEIRALYERLGIMEQI